MTEAVLDQYWALQSCQIHITYNFERYRITEKQANEVNFATTRAGADTCFPLKSTKEPCLHCKTKGPDAEAHPPFALGRDVHFCHSILQHVNICPGRGPARAGQVVPTGKLLHNPCLQAVCSSSQSPAHTHWAGVARLQARVWHTSTYSPTVCTSQHQTFIHSFIMEMCHTEGVTINTVNRWVGGTGVR